MGIGSSRFEAENQEATGEKKDLLGAVHGGNNDDDISQSVDSLGDNDEVEEDWETDCEYKTEADVIVRGGVEIEQEEDSEEEESNSSILTPDESEFGDDE
jgi:hypothetical protein